MKRFCFLSIILLSVCVLGTAQNANRSGFFAEFGLGAVMGTHLDIDCCDGIYYTEILPGYKEGEHNIRVIRKLPIVHCPGANVALGYRVVTSKHFAIDVKIKVDLEPFYTAGLGVIPSIRYVSSDFGGNKSFYFNVGVGCQLRAAHVYNKLVIYELGAGFNFSNHFYAGFSWDASWEIVAWQIHYGTLGPKIGCRF